MTDLDRLDALAGAATPEEALLDAIESQGLYYGRYGTTPAGVATARAILSCLRSHHRMDVVPDAAVRERDELREAARIMQPVYHEETHPSLGPAAECREWPCAALHHEDGAS